MFRKPFIDRALHVDTSAVVCMLFSFFFKVDASV